VISIHLSDDEITAAAAGERIPRTAHHLQICSECQDQVERYRESCAELRQDVCYSAGRSAIDWGRQSRSIHRRILAAQIEKTQGRNTGFAVVCSALAIALVMVLFVGFRNPAPTPSRIAGPAISDAALLEDVEGRMNEDLPDALQPANLLVDEMGGIQRPASVRQVHTRVRTAQ
jgi:hypothetical protein